MAFGADLDAYQGGAATVGPLALVEKKKTRSFFGITWGEIKLLTVAGVGFFMDAYDLFIINMIYAIIQVAYYTKVDATGAPVLTKGQPTFLAVGWGLNGNFLKASANIGNIVGQLLFGFLGDYYGRSAVYGKELLVIIFGVIMIIAAPDRFGGHGVTIWMATFRIIMGIGIGGDYPMSASVVADRSYMGKRGALLAWIFSNQGWGNIVGSTLAVIVIAGYKHYIVNDHDLHKLSGAWRILQGLALIPAFAVLYFRLTLVESTRFTQARQIQDDPELLAKASAHGIIAAEEDADLKKHLESPNGSIAPVENEAIGLKLATVGKKPKNEFIEYFSEWRHLKILLGTTVTWFAVDVAFYGINLNQSAILSAIGFTNGHGVDAYNIIWSKLMKTATGNLIICIAGFFPGYFITVATVEILGRKPIQILGFVMNMLFLGILAGRFDHLKTQTGPFFVVFVFLQLFFNFGANATTFIIPAEVFPTRVRSSAHGLSAACGKVGAILSSLLFGYIAVPKGSVPGNNIAIGQQNVFWIFFAFSALGLAFTFLLPETKGYDADEIDRQELADKLGAAGNIGHHDESKA